MHAFNQSQLGHIRPAACPSFQPPRPLRGTSRMRALSRRCSSRSGLHAAAGRFLPVAATFFVAAIASADDNSANSEKLQAAYERAEARWHEIHGATPSHIAAEEISVLAASDWEELTPSAQHVSFVEWMAFELAAFNEPEKVARYLNDAVIPFLKSHHDDYLCHFAELYYRAELSGDAIRNLPNGVGEAYFEYAYLYGHTASARTAMNLFIDPLHNDVAAEAVATNWRWPGAEIDLHCHAEDAEK